MQAKTQITTIIIFSFLLPCSVSSTEHDHRELYELSLEQLAKVKITGSNLKSKLKKE